MMKEMRLAPKNSLILVMDRTVGKVPESMEGSLVSSTDSCIAVGTLSEAEGETLVSLSDQMPARMLELLPVFDGVLNTPSRHLCVCSVLDEALMELDVPEPRTRVQVWTNDNSEPNEIRIVALKNQA